MTDEKVNEPASSHEVVKWSSRDGYIGYTRETALVRIETATQRLVKALKIEAPVIPSFPNDLAYDFAHKVDAIATLLENIVNAVAPEYQKQADKLAAKEAVSALDSRRAQLEPLTYPLLVNVAHENGIDPEILKPANGRWVDEDQARAAIIKALLATDVPSYALLADVPSLDDSVQPSFVSTPAPETTVEEDTKESEQTEDEQDEKVAPTTHKNKSHRK